MTKASSINPVPIGLDDGYAYTKVALSDGRLIVIPSRGRTGQGARICAIVKIRHMPGG